MSIGRSLGAIPGPGLPAFVRSPVPRGEGPGAPGDLRAGPTGRRVRGGALTQGSPLSSLTQTQGPPWAIFDGPLRGRILRGFGFIVRAWTPAPRPVSHHNEHRSLVGGDSGAGSTSVRAIPGPQGRGTGGARRSSRRPYGTAGSWWCLDPGFPPEFADANSGSTLGYFRRAPPGPDSAWLRFHCAGVDARTTAGQPPQRA